MSELRIPRQASRDINELRRLYRDFHWSAEPDQVINVGDTAVPNVVGIGRLLELHIPHVVKFPAGSWLAWDPAHPTTRLHIILPPSWRETARQAMKHLDTLPLPEIATATGGRQTKYPPLNLPAHPLGVIDHVVYRTLKIGDGKSSYIHEFGEETGIRPILALDVSGRLHIAGGDYRVTAAGIEN